MRRAAGSAALAVVLALGLAGPARAAGTAGSVAAPKLTTTTVADPNALTDAGAPTVRPPGHFRTPARVARVADALPKVRATRRTHPGSYRRIFLKGSARWQVSYYDRSGDKEIAQVLIDDSSGKVLETWTGFQVAWSMARGYPGAFGRRINSVIVWLPLCALFLLPFLGRRRRGLGLPHLDLLVLVSFSVSLAFFNHGNIGLSVPLCYPPLLYLLARMLWIGVTGRRGPPLTLRMPVAWAGLGLLFLIGFRVGLNLANSNVIDVGYAGVIGAHKILHGQALFGHFPSDNQHGRHLRPADLPRLHPVRRSRSGGAARWDDLPAAHATAVGFDVLALLSLWLLGRRLAGPALGVTLAWAWAAFPFTAYTLESNSNDSIVPALLRPRTRRRPPHPPRAGPPWPWPAWRSSPRWGSGPCSRGAREDGRLDRRELGLYVLGGALALGVLLVPVHFWWGGIHTMYDRTVAYQAHRGSPFSVWGLYGWTGLQHVVQAGAALGCLVLLLRPRERDLGRSAALAAAATIALQLGVTHWFYLYVVWFFPLVMIALCAPSPERALGTEATAAQEAETSTGSIDSARSGVAAVRMTTPMSQGSTSDVSKRTGIWVIIDWIACSRTHAEDAAARAGHAHVGDVGGPAREHAGVVGRDVRVGAHDRRHAAVEVPAEADLLARGLGVHVDEHVVDLVAQRVQLRVGLGERRAPGVEEDAARQVDHAQARPVALDHAAAVPGLGAQEVRRPQDPLLLVEVGVDLAVAVGVVAQRDHVDARGEELLGDLGRDPEPAGGVLAVDDDEVRRVRVAQAGQQPEQGPAARRPDDVADEEDGDGVVGGVHT